MTRKHKESVRLGAGTALDDAKPASERERTGVVVNCSGWGLVRTA